MAISKEQKKAIEKVWHDRAEKHDLKPGGKRYTDAKLHFLAGACAALHHMDPAAAAKPDKLSNNVPIMWVIGAISGRDPFETTEE